LIVYQIVIVADVDRWVKSHIEEVASFSSAIWVKNVWDHAIKTLPNMQDADLCKFMKIVFSSLSERGVKTTKRRGRSRLVGVRFKSEVSLQVFLTILVLT